MVNSPETLKGTERDQLGKLEASYADFCRRCEAFRNAHAARQDQITSLARDMALYGTVNPAQVTAANENQLRMLQAECEACGQWQTYFLGFETAARTLGAAGLPGLSVRLNEIEDDLAGLLRIYQEMSASLVQAMQVNAAIWNNAVQYSANTIQQVANTQAQVFNAFRERWSNETFNKCPLCGSLLQSRTLPYCWHCNGLVVRF